MSKHIGTKRKGKEMERKTNGMAIAALVCGIMGIVGSFIPVVNYFTTVLAILGIVFGVKGKKQAQTTGEGNGLATAGLVLGIIGAAFAVISLLCALLCVSSLVSLGSMG